jgi:uncharacterized protein YpuA (DUF1002 family)
MRLLVLIIVLLFIPSACMEQKAEHADYRESVYSSNPEDTAYSPLERAEDALSVTEGMEERIALVYHDADSLKVENKKLHKDLEKAIDSLTAAKKELESVRKVAKKKNFIQKVFNLPTDSITINDTL